MTFYCHGTAGDDFMTREELDLSNEIILEFTAVGGIMRVSAMDTHTLTEVVVQGRLTVDRSSLADLARQKLAFVMAKKGRRARR
jgi:hypothetical protein